MTNQPNRQDWAVADEFAQVSQEIDPAKVRNILRDRASLYAKN